MRVLQNGSGSDSDVIRGLDWVTAHVQQNGWPAVANMSLGGSAAPALDLALCRSIAGGVSYAVAAGNESANACGYSPARVLQAIWDGATDRNDRGASFTNTGECVSVFAPGVDITSARRLGGSITMSGTSMASPHVAGAVALCLERCPGQDPAAIKRCVLEHASTGKLGSIGRAHPTVSSTRVSSERMGAAGRASERRRSFPGALRAGALAAVPAAACEREGRGGGELSDWVRDHPHRDASGLASECAR